MYNFTFHVPTKIHFGKGQISHLSELAESGTKVLMVYGGGSIKRAGIYDEAMKILTEAGLTVYELSGIAPNPKIESVRDGVALCKQEGIDMVLAIGGGSTIDASKVIAAGAKYEGDPWDLVLDFSKITDALPIYAVLTLAATGSEMDNTAVISDMTKNEKWATFSPFMKPTMSILDPTYTYSVPAHQTAAGTADMMSHIMESYFTMETGVDIQQRFAEAMLKVAIKYGPIAMAEPDNYDARANLMWVSSHAINGLISDGCSPAWPIHAIEHELSAFYDITHGVGLAIMTPVWMEQILGDDTKADLAMFGRNVFGLDPYEEEDDFEVAKKAIECLKSFFFDTLKIPRTLTEVGITDDTYFEIMAEKAAKGSVGSYTPLSKDDIIELYRAAL